MAIPTPSKLAPAMQNTSDETSRISFLDLPAEIRNRIYELALTRSRKLVMCYAPCAINGINGSRRQIRLNSTRIFPSILKTCRAIYLEATPILYGDNRFYIKSPIQLKEFLQNIGRSVKYIRHIEVKLMPAERPVLKKEDLAPLLGAKVLGKIVLWAEDEDEDKAAEIERMFREVCEEREDVEGQVVEVEVMD